MHRVLFILILIILFPLQVPGQDTAFVTVVPGEEYEAGKIHRFFFGSHWRDLWTTPVRVPLLDLESFAGGIKPLKRGGGQQTRSLRFISRTGKEYKFRSVNKDPSGALPPELKESLASELVKDQTSSSHPLAPLIVAPILSAAGILQAEPMLCVLPDSKILGEFREEFAGMLGTIELHPDDFGDSGENFAGAEKVISTVELVERLEKDNDEEVKASDYLKARLVDILIGDWDRHIDQWRWVRFTGGDKKYWYPVPRDRDQAFARFDGLFPFISAMSITQLEHFSDSYGDVEGITWSGRNTDRRFLNSLGKQEWDSVMNFVKSSINDEVIISAVKKLPADMFEKAGQEMTEILRARRDKLNEISDDFYYQLSKYVSIHCSSKDEYAEINRLDGNKVEVKIFDLDKSKEPKEIPFFRRVFDADETSEIRVILKGGDDKAVVRGEVNESIMVIVAGDDGKDTLIDSSEVSGYFLGITPIPDAENKTLFIDSPEKTVTITGSSTVVRQQKEDKDADKVEPPRDWGHDWRGAPWLNVNPDDGLFIGGGAILYEFGFRRRPYVYRMELDGGYAAHAKRFRLRYTSEYNLLVKDLKFRLDAKTSGLEVLNFYGFGNETAFNGRLKDEDYYKVKQQELSIRPAVEYRLDASSEVSIGLLLKYIDTDEGRSLDNLKPYGTGNMLLADVDAFITYDTRTYMNFPFSGFYFRGGGAVFTPLKKSESVFYKIEADARLYLSLPGTELSSLAFRIAGEKIWGRFPFFEAAFLGGDNSLRGYDRNRFAGDAVVHSSAEMRLFLTRQNLFVPVYFGISGFGDAGRVFYPAETSRKIKASYGGGVWISFIKPEFLVTLYIARSPEETGLYFTTGFPF